MKIGRLLLLALIFIACHSSYTTIDKQAQYKAYMYVDSMARANPDSAFYYYNKASQTLTDSAYRGTALQRMAIIQQDFADYNGSNESAIQSLQLFDTKKKANFPFISFNYNLLATNCSQLQRYDDALKYYDLAFQFSDSANLAFYLNNKGVALQKKKAYGQAIELYQAALHSPMEDTTVYAMIISNLAKAKWLQDPGYDPVSTLHQARVLREVYDDQWGLNASYAHLADYYLKNQTDSARFYAEKMYTIAKKLNSADDQAEALEKLIRTESGTGMRAYFDRYNFLTDSIQTARRNATNQFADIRFTAEETRANNLLLEKDNSQKRLRITRQRVVIYATIGLFLFAILLGIWWYRKRKLLQEAKTRDAVRASQLKTSQKVHDIVANGLYRIMTDLEHTAEIPKEKLLDNIETLYEQSRDISYEQPVVTTETFAERLNSLLTSFATEETKVLVVGNHEGLWGRMSSATKEELVLVLQELMINMKKHSGAKNVVLKFAKDLNVAHVHYRDDGKGIALDNKAGNGMQIMGNRIHAIGGRIIFDGNPGKGLAVDISIPNK